MNSDRAIEAGCRYDLSIATLFQDEAPYLKEWIEFHKMMGVQHFVLVNDRSTDNFLEVLQPYVDAGEIEIIDWAYPEGLPDREWTQYQCAVISAMVTRLRGVTRWLALIDTDEFMVPAVAATMLEFLKDYEDYGGIYVRWEPFGTSRVPKLSDRELLTEKLYLKWKFVPGFDMLGKSIVKPHRVLYANIHHCTLAPGYPYLDSNPGMVNDVSYIKLHHYWARDVDFLLNKKLPRTLKIKGWEVDWSNLEYFLTLFNDIPDYGMSRFIPELKMRVFSSDETGEII